MGLRSQRKTIVKQTAHTPASRAITDKIKRVIQTRGRTGFDGIDLLFEGVSGSELP